MDSEIIKLLIELLPDLLDCFRRMSNAKQDQVVSLIRDGKAEQVLTAAAASLKSGE